MTLRVLAVDEPACSALAQDGSAPRRIGRRGSPFSVCGFWSCSRKRGRLDWHQPGTSQLAWCSSAPKITVLLLCHGSLTPCWRGTGALRVSAGGAGGSCPCPEGCARGWSSLPSFPRELGGVYGPAYHVAPLIPLIGAGGPVRPCRIRILPAGLQEEGAQARTMPTPPPAHGPGATGGSGHMGDPVTSSGGPAARAWSGMGRIYRLPTGSCSELSLRKAELWPPPRQRQPPQALLQHPSRDRGGLSTRLRAETALGFGRGRVAWRGVRLRRAGRSNRPILRHKSGRNAPGWRGGGSRLEMPRAELVIEVQHVRAWPSSACPSAGHVPAGRWHTGSWQGT